MLFGNLKSPTTYYPLINHPIWDKAFNTLRGLNHNTPLGITVLKDEMMFLNVHRYSTKPREKCRLEGHKQMIDVQYMIQGAEIIEWADKRRLFAEEPYDPEKDIQFFRPPDSACMTQLHLQAGKFAIFFSDDVHRPQISDHIESFVYKAVIKIDKKMFAH